MLTPSSIDKEVKAIKALKSVKVSLWQSIVYASVIITGITGYFTVFRPSIEKIEKIQTIHDRLVSYDTSLTVIRNNMAEKGDIKLLAKKNDIDSIKTKLDFLYRENVRMSLKMSIIKEEIPKMNQRFDDVDKSIEKLHFGVNFHNTKREFNMSSNDSVKKKRLMTHCE
jgi:predicted nuclease with TOPRIM domain